MPATRTPHVLPLGAPVRDGASRTSVSRLLPGANVLVTDGEQRAALALVRSLGRAGYRVHVCSTGGESLAGASRHALSETKVPDPLANPDGFVQSVRWLAKAVNAKAILPIAEPALLALLPARDLVCGGTLNSTIIPFPSEAVFRRACDKAEVARVAASLGIAVPEQVEVASAAEALARIAELPAFPVVLKPSRSVGEAGGSRQKTSVRYAADRSELERQLEALGPAAYPLLIQRQVVGPGTGVFLLRWNGATRARFAHRRLLEKPPSGGVSVLRESIEAPADLVARSEALLAALDWQGVAMVEYKVHAATGVPYLMEINGRFWGSLQLALDAGVDFPRLLLECAAGTSPIAPPPYKVGVRSRWFWGTMDHLVVRARRRVAEVPGVEMPSVARVVGDLLTAWRPGEHEEVFRIDDPRPFLRETQRWLDRS